MFWLVPYWPTLLPACAAVDVLSLCNSFHMPNSQCCLLECAELCLVVPDLIVPVMLCCAVLCCAIMQHGVLPVGP
jgi:hypothetical protein